jgi:hypothetical protein
LCIKEINKKRNKRTIFIKIKKKELNKKEAAKCRMNNPQLLGLNEIAPRNPKDT